MATEQTSSSMTTCKWCQCEVGGDPVNVMPLRVDGGNDDYETFCPQCFVYHRGPLEPLRFSMPNYLPVHCGRCGWDSVAVGLMRCQNCSNGAGLLTLPPKPSA